MNWQAYMYIALDKDFLDSYVILVLCKSMHSYTLSTINDSQINFPQLNYVMVIKYGILAYIIILLNLNCVNSAEFGSYVFLPSNIYHIFSSSKS